MRGINTGNMCSARMAKAAAVTFIVACASVLSGLAPAKAKTLTGDCSGVQEGAQEVNVTDPDTTVELKCHTDDKVTPAFNQGKFQVCTNNECTSPPLLSELINGAAVKSAGKETATIEIKKLPPKATTFYILCGEKASKPCYIQVNVAQSKPGGVTPGSPISCAKPGGAVTIKIPEKGSKAQFTCDGWTLYPVATDSVFAENCKKEESLKGLVRSTDAKVHTLTAVEKPPKKKWCFLCAGPSVNPNHLGTASDYCLVHVESSSRTQASSGIALAVMLPCILAMLRIT